MNKLPKFLVIILITSVILVVKNQDYSLLQTTDSKSTTINAEVTEDHDGDGMPSVWELLYGLNPADPSDATLDPDNDGLTNLQEYNIGTDPTNPDTDSGGINDGQEVANGTDPLDGMDDYDYLIVDEEDSDDGDKDNKTKKRKKKSAETLDLKNIDTDLDGISDYDELYIYMTNPYIKDSDSDRLSDFQEIFVYFTNPNNKDTDYDGLSDYDEIFTYYTSPLKWDTDNGGVSDGDEILNSTNPLDPLEDYSYLKNLPEISYYIENTNAYNYVFNDINNNLITTYDSLDFTLVIKRNEYINNVKVKYKGVEYLSEKEVFALKLSTKDSGSLELLQIMFTDNEGNEFRITKNILIKPSGKIYLNYVGDFNKLIDLIGVKKPLESYIAQNVVITIETFNKNLKILEHSDNLLRESYAHSSSNRYKTKSFLIILEPATYNLSFTGIFINKLSTLITSDYNDIYSNNVTLHYSADTAIWVFLYLLTFTVTYLFLKIILLIEYKYLRPYKK